MAEAEVWYLIFACPRMKDAMGAGKRRVRIPKSVFDQIELQIAI